MAQPFGDLDVRWPAVIRGVATGLALIVPLAGLNALVDDPSDTDGGWRILIFFAVLGALFLAGRAAGLRASAAPMSHGALAGIGTMAVWAALRAVIGLIADGEAGYGAWSLATFALYGVGLGIMGAVAGARKSIGHPPTADPHMQ
jgi:hypothetical protein